MSTINRARGASPLLEVDGLRVEYRRGLRRSPFRAVDDVSFTVDAGETLSIVGESGSGKSTIGGAILGLRDIAGGTIRLRGEDITRVGRGRRRKLSEDLQAVFQDPYSSLDPARTVGDAIAEPLIVGTALGRADVNERVLDILKRVGLPAAAAAKFPAEFSGGQRQRIAIARAVIRRPALIVCDEAVSALDVSIQAQVLNLLDDLQKEVGTSYVFVSHNISVVRHISDRILVLYRGRIMEEGDAELISNSPAHPYTRALLAAVPVPDVTAQRARREKRKLATAQPDIVIPADSVGCPFAARCPFAQQKCVDAPIPLVQLDDGRRVACIRVDEIPAVTEPPLPAVLIQLARSPK
jgi:oligopeptide/dipeptide ABC transporter ATP-binding protein